MTRSRKAKREPGVAYFESLLRDVGGRPTKGLRTDNNPKINSVLGQQLWAGHVAGLGMAIHSDMPSPMRGQAISAKLGGRHGRTLFRPIGTPRVRIDGVKCDCANGRCAHAMCEELDIPASCATDPAAAASWLAANACSSRDSCSLRARRPVQLQGIQLVSGSRELVGGQHVVPWVMCLADDRTQFRFNAARGIGIHATAAIDAANELVIGGFATRHLGFLDFLGSNITVRDAADEEREIGEVAASPAAQKALLAVSRSRQADALLTGPVQCIDAACARHANMAFCEPRRVERDLWRVRATNTRKIRAGDGLFASYDTHVWGEQLFECPVCAACDPPVRTVLRGPRR